MKIFHALLILLISMIPAMVNDASAQAPGAETIVGFTDRNLENAVRETLAIYKRGLTAEDLRGIRTLDASQRNIANLEGLQFCTNLEFLDLGPSDYLPDPIPNPDTYTDPREYPAPYIDPRNRIRNLSPLAGLTSLKVLNLGENLVRDIGPLENLAAIEILDLGFNQITSLSPLSGLTNLRKLSLGANGVLIDLEPLRNMTELTELYLNSSEIDDIAPLRNLTKLEILDLSFNRISDPGPVSGMTQLKKLYLSANRIESVSALSGLNELTELTLSENLIVDITPLAGLNGLTILDLSYNLIYDISPVSNFNSLDRLNLNFNRISDIAPLAVGTSLNESSCLNLWGNPLDDPGFRSLIAELQNRGVYVDWGTRDLAFRDHSYSHW